MLAKAESGACNSRRAFTPNGVHVYTLTNIPRSACWVPRSDPDEVNVTIYQRGVRDISETFTILDYPARRATQAHVVATKVRIASISLMFEGGALRMKRRNSVSASVCG